MPSIIATSETEEFNVLWTICMQYGPRIETYQVRKIYPTPWGLTVSPKNWRDIQMAEKALERGMIAPAAVPALSWDAPLLTDAQFATVKKIMQQAHNELWGRIGDDAPEYSADLLLDEEWIFERLDFEEIPYEKTADGFFVMREDSQTEGRALKLNFVCVTSYAGKSSSPHFEGDIAQLKFRSSWTAERFGFFLEFMTRYYESIHQETAKAQATADEQALQDWVAKNTYAKESA